MIDSSDEYTELYPYAPDAANLGGTHMKTAEEVKAEKIVTELVREDCDGNILKYVDLPSLRYSRCC